MADRRQRREERAEQARRRADRREERQDRQRRAAPPPPTDEELANRIRIQYLSIENLYAYMTKALNVKLSLVERSKELEARAAYFARGLSPAERIDPDQVNILIYEQGILDGRLQEMNDGVFQQLRTMKSAITEQGVDREAAMEAELCEILIAYEKIKACSKQLSRVLEAHKKK